MQKRQNGCLRRPTNPCYHHIDTVHDCSMYCLTHFVSAQVKLQNAMLVQQGCINIQLLKISHSPLDGHHYKDSEA